MQNDRITDGQSVKLKDRQSESLRYASYIQQAILPSGSQISKIIPDYFVFYEPREIVSGDFYYISRRNNLIYIGIGDCTGHGVPGALMSILGITFLNEIVSHGLIYSAGTVLNKLRERVMDALCQTGEDDERKDGMDLALCIIDKERNLMSFAGAFNPVYIVSDNELVEIQGDMMPVGIGAEEEISFTSHEIALKSGDVIYMFTDGYADQFGGSLNRKFKYRTFREMLLEHSHLEMKDQKKIVQETFRAWKGNLQQIDDVLVFGFRYQLSD